MNRIIKAAATLTLAGAVFAGSAQASTPSCATIRSNATKMKEMAEELSETLSYVDDAADTGDIDIVKDACALVPDVAKRYTALGKKLKWSDVVSGGEALTKMAASCKKGDIASAGRHMTKFGVFVERTTAAVNRCR